MAVMDALLTLGETLSAQARLQPDRIGARDLERAMSFREWNRRSCRLANALLGLGLRKGDRVAVLAYNCVEWTEIYAATAKAGLVAVPINFRLAGPEIRFIVENSGASLLIVQDQLFGAIENQLADFPLKPGRLVQFGAAKLPAGLLGYEDILARASDTETGVAVDPADPWMLMYTSGTTGKPKGVIRSHRGAALLSLVTDIELGIGRDDEALLVMPMCHANSLYFFGSFAYCGGAISVYSRKSFDPEEALTTIGTCGASFTSLVPTHYIMMLALSDAVKAKHDTRRMRRLMISSAPAREDTKRGVMAMFANSGLFELYGSTEAGWVTMLHPDEQFTKLGSVGRECVGSSPIRILGPDGTEMPDGRPGELYSRNPHTFDGYWHLPDKTRDAFRDGYCTVGDMALRDADGYIRLVDRKQNMIITGGENVYPSEVEAVVGAHPKVQDVAVIGLPDAKWGEHVHAVVVAQIGAELTDAELDAWCRERIAGFKRPRGYSFLRPEQMPRTATGKIRHRVLRETISRPQG
jgi:acyl-CoA synthetase (AMP-forming)/AMP-acid ligase II